MWLGSLVRLLCRVNWISLWLVCVREVVSIEVCVLRCEFSIEMIRVMVIIVRVIMMISIVS